MIFIICQEFILFYILFYNNISNISIVVISDLSYDYHRILSIISIIDLIIDFKIILIYKTSFRNDYCDIFNVILKKFSVYF